MRLASTGMVSLADGTPRTLVVIFLRGGADGLTLVPPVGDDAYHRARPRLRVEATAAPRLDGRFALHPALAPLHPLFAEGQLAIVHAVGSEDATRSHFEAQDLMEHGGVTGGGWLGRFLRHREATGSRALAAVALGTEIPECLRGAPAATVFRSIADLALGDGGGAFTRSLAVLYGAAGGQLGQAARDTLEATRRLEALRLTDYRPAAGAHYADDDFARALRQVAQLVKARVGLEAASIDLGGWDSHVAQQALLEPLMGRLAAGLAAFAADLGPWLATTSVVVMTEFGRRVAENASLGTDHGRGSVMLVLGGGVAGGRVAGSWPGLEATALEGPGDLPVRTNYRDVLGPVLARHGAGAVLDRVFPSFTLHPLAL
jgi:uncharacterized protein (DUF1501 family)